MRIICRFSWNELEFAILQYSSFIGITFSGTIYGFSFFGHYIIAILRVECIVSAEIKMINIEGNTGGFLYIHDDMTFDAATVVVASDYIAEFTTGDGQLHVAIHIGVVSTTENKRNCHIGFTAHDNLQVTVHVGIFTGTYQLPYVQITIARGGVLWIKTTFCNINANVSIDGSLLITATESLMHRAAKNHGVCVAIDIGSGVWLPSCIILILILTITTAEHSTNFVGTIDVHIGLRNGSGVTATIDSLDTG